MAELKLQMQIGRFQRRSTNSLWLIAMVFIIAQSSVFVVGDWSCLRCEDFNRHPNKKLQCAKRYSDCGECISGFIPDLEDDRLCFSLEILEMSEDVTEVSDKVDVYLPCKFNARVTCKWTKNGNDVKIIHPYKWSYGNGIETDDCSINIESLSTTDTGTWVCSNQADSYVDSIHSRGIEVSITTKITVHPKPTYNVSAGESVTVECQFDHPVKCSWMKDRRPVKPTSNYQFNEKDTTTDCSLTIRAFNLNNDQGNWTCLQLGNSEKEAIASQTAVIHGYISPAGFKMAKYSTSVTIEKEPTIYFGEQEVTRGTIEYVPGVSVDSLLSVSCRAWSGAVGMSWLLHGAAEHLGLRLGDTEINVDTQLETDLINRLQSQQQVELMCLVEYPDKESHSAIVTFINVAPQPAQAASSLTSLFSILIGIIVVMFCMVFVAIGFIIYYFRKSKKRNTAKENKSTPQA